MVALIDVSINDNSLGIHYELPSRERGKKKTRLALVMNAIAIRIHSICFFSYHRQLFYGIFR